MTASVPLVAPSFAPDEEQEPEQGRPAAQARPRTGRHEPIRSSLPRIVGRGAALGLTVAAGVAGGHYLRNDLNAGLVAGAQLGSVAAGMAFAGAWAERRRMTRIAGTLSDLAGSPCSAPCCGRPPRRPGARRPGQARSLSSTPTTESSSSGCRLRSRRNPSRRITPTERVFAPSTP